MTFYDPWYSGGARNYTWNGVEIGKMQKDGEVYVTNLPSINKTAFGRWNAASQSIILEGGVYFSSEVFVNPSTGVNTVAIFEPVYYSRAENKAYWNRDANNVAYIRLKIQSDGSVAMVAPDNVGSSGNYSNAFLWYYYNYDTKEYTEDYSDVVVEATLKKTSSSVSVSKRANAPVKAVTK